MSARECGHCGGTDVGEYGDWWALCCHDCGAIGPMADTPDEALAAPEAAP